MAVPRTVDVSNKTKRQKELILLWQLTFWKYAGQGFETQPNGSTERVAADLW
jgi:hypothetical protein